MQCDYHVHTAAQCLFCCHFHTMTSKSLEKLDLCVGRKDSVPLQILHTVLIGNFMSLIDRL